MMPIRMQAINALVADILGRGSAASLVRASETMRLFTLGMLAGSYVGGRLESEKQAYRVCSLLDGLAALLVFTQYSETLLPSMRRPFTMRAAANPFGFLRFFFAGGGRGRPRFAALAVLHLMYQLPAYLQMDEMVRRSKFKDWNRERQSRLMTFSQVVSFLSTYLTQWMMNSGVTTPFMRVQLSIACQIVSNLNTILAPSPDQIGYLNAVLFAPVCGMQQIGRQMAQESLSHDVGQGELSGHLNNLSFFPSLIMPNVFSELFARCAQNFPAAPFCLALAIRMINFCVVVPWVYRTIGSVPSFIPHTKKVG